MTEKTEFLLKMAFVGKAKEQALPMLGTALLDYDAYELINHYEKVKKYIKVDTVKSQIIKEWFDKYYKYENINMPIIKNYLITNLSEIVDFEWGYGGLFYKGVGVNTWNWDKVVGGRQWECFPRAYVETVIYNGERDYEGGRKNLKLHGIEFWGGGTVADYINSAMSGLKPHVLEAIEELKK